MDAHLLPAYLVPPLARDVRPRLSELSSLLVHLQSASARAARSNQQALAHSYSAQAAAAESERSRWLFAVRVVRVLLLAALILVVLARTRNSNALAVLAVMCLLAAGGRAVQRITPWSEEYKLMGTEKKKQTPAHDKLLARKLSNQERVVRRRHHSVEAVYALDPEHMRRHVPVTTSRYGSVDRDPYARGRRC